MDDYASLPSTVSLSSKSNSDYFESFAGFNKQRPSMEPEVTPQSQSPPSAQDTFAQGGGYRRPTNLRSLSSSRNAAEEHPPSSTRNPAPSTAAATTATGTGPPPSYRAANKKKNGHRDLIDQLDISSMFLPAGSSFHHSGPLDAASPHRNKSSGRLAPVAAFKDPAGDMYRERSQSQPPSRPTGSERYNSNWDNTTASKSGESFLTADEHGLAAGPSAGSHRSVHLGYPLPHLDHHDAASQAPGSEQRREASRAKAAAYAEAFGFQDNEAWEDYGRSKWSRESPRESTYQLSRSPASRVALTDNDTANSASLSKFSRAERTASVWDMEATLKAGVPVASAAPPIPSLPPQYAGTSGESTTSANPPKRSKSLLNRVRRKNGDLSASQPAPSRPSLRVVPATNLVSDTATTSAPVDAPADWKLADRNSPRASNSSSVSNARLHEQSTAIGPSIDNAMHDKSRDSVTMELLNDLTVSSSEDDIKAKSATPEASPKQSKLGRSTSLMQRIKGKR